MSDETRPRPVLTDEQGEVVRAGMAKLAHDMRELTDAVARALEQLSRDLTPALRAFAQHIRDAGLATEEPPSRTHAAARALWLRQHRNTGPTPRTRPPRALDPRKGRP